jgi:hypothetical protein
MLRRRRIQFLGEPETTRKMIVDGVRAAILRNRQSQNKTPPPE